MTAITETKNLSLSQAQESLTRTDNEIAKCISCLEKIDKACTPIWESLKKFSPSELDTIRRNSAVIKHPALADIKQFRKYTSEIKTLEAQITVLEEKKSAALKTCQIARTLIANTTEKVTPVPTYSDSDDEEDSITISEDDAATVGQTLQNERRVDTVPEAQKNRVSTVSLQDRVLILGFHARARLSSFLNKL